MDMDAVFIGCVKSSEVFLRKLCELDINIVGVITKAQSNFNSDFVDLSTLCKENAIDCIFVEDINDKDSVSYIKNKKPDIIFCLGWSRLLKQQILEIPRLGTVGFHPAALPYNRGRHPLIWALALGLQETASTFFLMNEGADTGDIISQKKIHINYEDDAATLYAKVLKAGCTQLEEIVNGLNNGKLMPLRQTVSDGNSWRKRGITDGKIDWRMSSRAIYNLVRALTKPYVGAHFEYKGREYKVWKVKEIETDSYDNIECGKIIEVFGLNHFMIKVYDGLIEVVECDNIDLQAGDYL